MLCTSTQNIYKLFVIQRQKLNSIEHQTKNTHTVSYLAMLNNCIALARPEAQSIIVVLVSASMMDFKVPWIPLCAELPWLVIVNNQNW